MTHCACTWLWTYRQDGRKVEPHEHMEGICPLYAPRLRCTCALAYGPAEKVAAELHEEDCALYLAALKAESVAADERIVRDHERRRG